jgi:hypothetical protein
MIAKSTTDVIFGSWFTFMKRCQCDTCLAVFKILLSGYKRILWRAAQEA